MDLEFILNSISGQVRRATLHGRSYLVAPMTMIVPGVLNGSRGALYYPAEEIGRDSSIWNGMPILHRHPPQGKSGRDPEVIESQGLGTVFKAYHAEDGALNAEGWFDEDRTKSHAPEIYKRLDNALRKVQHDPVELSTGLFTDNYPAHNGAKCPKTGRPYDFVARNYRADHLAVFTDQKGACSVNDGCGVGVRNSAGDNSDYYRELLAGDMTENVAVELVFNGVAVETEEVVENDYGDPDDDLDDVDELAEGTGTDLESDLPDSPVHFFLTLLHCVTGAHLLHLQTRSFAAHSALDTLYKELPGLVDELVESYQGRYGIVSDYPTGFTPPDPSGSPADYVDSVRGYVAENRDSIGNDTELQNILDGIAGLLDSTHYKLRWLS